MPKIEVIIVAAGKGRRIKSKIPKPFIILKNKPLLFYTLRVFQDHPLIKKIILVVEKENIKKAQALVKKYRFRKVKEIVVGGRERKDSVINGLHLIDKETKFILIHDGVRPFIRKELISEVIRNLKKYRAVIPGFPVQDTLKYINSKNIVKKTLKRENLYHIQTPQGFRRDILPLLIRGIKKSKSVYDESMLIEKRIKVKLISGHPLNIKITTPYDLLLAKLYLEPVKSSVSEAPV